MQLILRKEKKIKNKFTVNHEIKEYVIDSKHNFQNNLRKVGIQVRNIKFLF